MAFIYAKTLNNKNYPITEYFPSTASETYTMGEALVLSAGKLTKCGTAVKPTYISLIDYIAPSSDNLDIPVNALLSEDEYQAPFIADATAAVIGTKLRIGTDGLTLTGSTGTHQYTTATAAGTVTTAGNAAVTVTSALLTDGSKAIAVPVVLDDTANAIALAIRTALAADEDIAANFVVSGATNKVILTTLLYAADDETLNIAIDDGTGEGASEGVTAAATSTTTAGVADTGTVTLIRKLGTGAIGTLARVRVI